MMGSSTSGDPAIMIARIWRGITLADKADAYIDYRAMGGVDGRYPEVKAWLAQVLPNFPAYAHMLGNFDVKLHGDTATSRTLCFNPMVLGGDEQQVLFCGLWYDDEFVRTGDGWRMTKRVEEKCFDKVV